MFSLKIPALKISIRDAIDADEPAFIWGIRGIGKSQAVRQVADEIRADHVESLIAAGLVDVAEIRAESARIPTMIDIRLSYYDPTDLRGIPCNVDGRTVWLKPETLFPALENRFGFVTVFFFDETDRAPMAVLNPALQLFLDRAIGEHKLPATARLIAAGNGATDRGTTRLSDALMDRFTHLWAEFCPAALCDYFDSIGTDATATAFLRMRPALADVSEMRKALAAGDDSLRSIVAGIDSGAEKVTPSARSWEVVANRFAGLPRERRLPLISGRVGKAVALEYEAFRDIIGRAPSIASIVADPAGAPVPADIGVQWILASAIARVAKPENFAALAQYAARLPAEFETVAIGGAARRDESLKALGGYTAFILRHPAFSLNAI